MQSDDDERLAFDERPGRMAPGVTCDGLPVAVPTHGAGRSSHRPPCPLPQRGHRSLACRAARDGADRCVSHQPVRSSQKKELKGAPRSVAGAPHRIHRPARSRTAVRWPEGTGVVGPGSHESGRTGLHRTSRTSGENSGRGAPAYSAEPNPEAVTVGGRPIRPSGHYEGSTPSGQGRPVQTSMQEVLPIPALTHTSNARSVHWSDRSTDREESAPLVVNSLVRHWGGTFRSQPPSHEGGGNEVVEGRMEISSDAEKTDRGSLLNRVTKHD